MNRAGRELRLGQGGHEVQAPMHCCPAVFQLGGGLAGTSFQEGISKSAQEKKIKSSVPFLFSLETLYLAISSTKKKKVF